MRIYARIGDWVRSKSDGLTIMLYQIQTIQNIKKLTVVSLSMLIASCNSTTKSPVDSIAPTNETKIHTEGTVAFSSSSDLQDWQNYPNAEPQLRRGLKEYIQNFAPNWNVASEGSNARFDLVCVRSNRSSNCSDVEIKCTTHGKGKVVDTYKIKLRSQTCMKAYDTQSYEAEAYNYGLEVGKRLKAFLAGYKNTDNTNSKEKIDQKLTKINNAKETGNNKSTKVTSRTHPPRAKLPHRQNEREFSCFNPLNKTCAEYTFGTVKELNSFVQKCRNLGSQVLGPQQCSRQGHPVGCLHTSGDTSVVTFAYLMPKNQFVQQCSMTGKPQYF